MRALVERLIGRVRGENPGRRKAGRSVLPGQEWLERRDLLSGLGGAEVQHLGGPEPVHPSRVKAKKGPVPSPAVQQAVQRLNVDLLMLQAEGQIPSATIPAAVRDISLAAAYARRQPDIFALIKLGSDYDAGTGSGRFNIPLLTNDVQKVLLSEGVPRPLVKRLAPDLLPILQSPHLSVAGSGIINNDLRAILSANSRG